MKLTNTIIQITVVIPELEVVLESGLPTVRKQLKYNALNSFIHGPVSPNIEMQILDCPSYPALNE